eukprot:TRINITY_DN11443_c1_g1_i1.p1 TRINITY_DN11443_c1_g1~~TRINITY_DN11443_c1_g1_i1.p1  ORF type:complete len:346 (-),score=60.24 TRINITY_DN11443_c1_g1_i1:199-1176(-)
MAAFAMIAEEPLSSQQRQGTQLVDDAQSMQGLHSPHKKQTVQGIPFMGTQGEQYSTSIPVCFVPVALYCVTQGSTKEMMFMPRQNIDGVVYNQDEFLLVLDNLEYARPVAVKGSTGEEFTVEWHSRAHVFPSPAAEDYPLTITESFAWATTLLIKMLPDHVDRDMFAGFLKDLGFGMSFDLLYVPCSFWDGRPLAYGFCNLRSHELAVWLKETLQGYTWPGSDKTCEVTWAFRQGYSNNVAHFQESKANHPHIPDAMKPMVYDHMGVPCAIRSTKVTAPKVKYTKRHGDRSFYVYSKESKAAPVKTDEIETKGVEERNEEAILSS